MTAKEGGATLVNILSMGHSGSTMLDLMLGGHSRARSLGEVYVAYYPFKDFHFREGPPGQASQMLWDVAERTPRRRFHQEVHVNTGASFLIDSSKHVLWAAESMKAARTSGMAVANIILWKEPQTLDFSFWRRGDRGLKWLNRYKVYYNRILQLGVPFVSVSYEAMVTRPRATLERIGKSIGMAVEDRQEQFWNHPVEHLFGNQGTRAQAGTRSDFRPPGLGLPDEYLAVLPGIKAQLQRDPELQQLLRRLEANPAGDRLDVRFPHSQIHLPWWFYEQKLRRTLRARRIRKGRVQS